MAPSRPEQMIASLAQGLHLSLDERDHLFRLAGHRPPERGAGSDHVSPGMLRTFDRLTDTPAEIVTELGGRWRADPPRETPLVGDSTRFTGPERSIGYRWFTLPAARELHPPEDHDHLSRMYVSGLREISALRGPDSRAARYAARLLDISDEFRTLWDEHQVGITPNEIKRFCHPSMGLLGAELPDPPGPAAVTLAPRLHRGAGERELDELELLGVVGHAAG